jgi:thermopsin
MTPRPTLLIPVIFVTSILLLSSLGLLTDGAGHSATAPSQTSFGAVATAPAPPRAPGTFASLAPHESGENQGLNPMAVSALDQARAQGIPTRDVFVPRAGATPTQLAHAQSQGFVTPGYAGTAPAPIGLADYGLSANPNGNGSVVPSILNTPSVMATFDPNATGVQPLYPFSSTPDGYGVQLNAVTTDVSLFGGSNYSFWTQNVVEYLAQSHTMYIVSNVWNFSGGPLSTNVFFAHGANGTQVGTEFYYAFYQVPTPVTYPFNLTLWMNNSVLSGRNAVNFTVALTQGGVTSIYPYDYVIFNSTIGGGLPAPVSEYTANGYTYNPIGLTDDFEVILGGPGGGSQADLYAADANMSLQYWNATSASYRAIPSAYSYGGETGETVTGAYVGWQNDTGGAPYGVVRTGPSILSGLWNASGAPGLGEVQFTLHPGNLWLFVAPNWTSNFTYEGLPNWAPQETTSTFWLTPGNYNISAMLSDYTATNFSITVTTGVTPVLVQLTSNPTLGIYTPLWVWNDSQFSNVSTGGVGTPSDPYQLVNSQTTVMPSVFGTWNDFTFPVFTGVFLQNTNASVVMADMGPLLTSMPYSYAASLDALGYLLYNTSNVALVNSTNISGWYANGLDDAIDPTGTYAGNYYGTFSVLLWNSTHDLIADDTFETQTAGLSLYGGGNNTVWGNTFTMAPFPTFPIPGYLSGLNLSLGLQEGENGDLVYNNDIDTTTTAVTVPADLYTGAPLTPVDTWNITPTPASTVNTAPHFPDFPLTGTIVGNATQGGNFWYDYGGASNPTGVLPYDEVVNGVNQILVGGDYYPLVPPNVTHYLVQFVEAGLPNGTAWSVSVDSQVIHGSGATLNVSLANGSYLFTPGVVAGYSVSPTNGTVVVNGGSAMEFITYIALGPPPSWAVTFSEAGLPSGTTWSVTLVSTTHSSTGVSITFEETNGSFAWSLGSVPGFAGTPTSGSVSVNGAPVTREITFSAPISNHTVAFVESGLPAGTTWSVTLGFSTNQSATTTIDFSVTPQVYGYVVGSVGGYTPSPSSASVAVVSNVTVGITFSKLVPGQYTVTFAESGLATATNWTVQLGSTSRTSNGTTVVFTEGNGSLSFSIPTVVGYTVIPSSGVLDVAGATVSKAVKFTSVAPGKYALTFTESGLPSGTNWSVTISGTTESSGGGSVVSFQEANNTYTFQVGVVAGFAATPTSGSVTLSGAQRNVGITFSTSVGPPPSNSAGGLTSIEWAIVAVVAVLALLAVIVVLQRRRRGSARSYPPAGEEAYPAPPEPEEPR